MVVRELAILASGTLGDVRPCVALGLGLQQAGLAVRVVTHEPFRALVVERGLAFTPLAGSPNDLLAATHAEALTLGANPARSLVASIRFLYAARPLFAQMLASAWQACQGAGALLATLPTIWGLQLAERLEVPAALALFQPISRTAAFPTPFQPFQFAPGPVYNRLSHRALEQLLWRPWQAPLARWRTQTLGLPVLAEDPFDRIYRRRTPFVYGFSPRVVARPADWPPEHVVTGYWFTDSQRGWSLPDDLQAFLERGAPAIFVGFGSTAVPSQTWLTVRQAVRQAGARAVAQGAPPELAAADFLVIGAMPHSRLFPHMAALVHHGGAGVTAEGFRVGLPALAVPVGTDQFFWGQQLARLGVGPPPLPRRSLEPEPLAVALRQLLQDPGLRVRANGLGEAIRQEDGVAAGVRALLSLL